MPSLLDLPLELRYSILEFAIKFADVQPPDPEHAGSRVERNDMQYRSLLAGTGINYSKRRPDTLLTPLLLVNRQIHDETLIALHLTPSHYELDVMIVDEELFPTWIYVPPFKQNLETLYITVRTFGISNHNSNGFSDSEGRAGDAILRFYSLFERFAFFGAGDRLMTETRAKIVRIKMLDLNFVTPTTRGGLAPNEVSPEEQAAYLAEIQKNQTLHQQILLETMKLWITGVCRIAFQNPRTELATWGELLLRCIGSVRFKLDGEVEQTICFEQDMRAFLS
jgi:hypothetical protein